MFHLKSTPYLRSHSIPKRSNGNGGRDVLGKSKSKSWDESLLPSLPEGKSWEDFDFEVEESIKELMQIVNAGAQQCDSGHASGKDNDVPDEAELVASLTQEQKELKQRLTIVTHMVELGAKESTMMKVSSSMTLEKLEQHVGYLQSVNEGLADSCDILEYKLDLIRRENDVLQG